MLALVFSTILVSHLCLASCGYSSGSDGGYNGYQPHGGSGHSGYQPPYGSNGGGSSSSSGGWGWGSMTNNKPKDPIYRFYSFNPNRSKDQGHMHGWMSSSGSGYNGPSSGYGHGSSSSSSGYGSSYPASSQWTGTATSWGTSSGRYGANYNDAGWGSNQRPPPPPPRWSSSSIPTFPQPNPMIQDDGWGSNFKPPPSHPMDWSTSSRYPQSPSRDDQYPPSWNSISRPPPQHDYDTGWGPPRSPPQNSGWGQGKQSNQLGMGQTSKRVTTELDPNYYSPTPWPEEYAKNMMQNSMNLPDSGRYASSYGGGGGRYQRSQSRPQFFSPINQTPFPYSGQYNLRF